MPNNQGIQIDIEALVTGLRQVESLANQLEALGPAGQRAATGAEATSRASGRAANSSNLLTGALKKVAPALSAAFVVDKINETAEALDKTAKSAARLGISGEELQKLQYSADLAGVSSSQLDSILERLVRTVDDAATGSGEAAIALGRLGLKAEDLQKLPLEQQFLEIGEALNGISDDSQRAALAMEVFGRGNAEVLNLTKQGAKAIREQGDELSRLGGIVDNETLAAAERYNDSLTRMGRLWDGLKAKAFGPVFESVAEAMEGAATAAAHLGDETESLSAKAGALANAYSQVSDAAVVSAGDLTGFNGVAQIAKSILEGLGLVAESAAEDIKDAGAATEELGVATTAAAPGLAAMAEETKRAAEEQAKLDAALKTLKLTVDETTGEVVTKSQAAADAFAAIATAADTSAEKIKNAFDAAIKQIDEVSKLADVEKALSEAVEAGKISAEEATAARENLIVATTDLIEKEIKGVETQADLAKAIARTAEAAEAGSISAATLAEAKDALNKKADELRRTLGLTADQMDTLRDALANMVTPAQQAAISTDALQEAQNRLRTATDSLRAEINSGRQDIYSYAEEVINARAAVDQMEAASKQLGTTFTQWVKPGLGETRQGFDELRAAMNAAASSANATRSAIVNVGLQAAASYREGVISASEFNAIVSQGVPKFVELGTAGEESGKKIKGAYDEAAEAVSGLGSAIDSAEEKAKAARGGRGTGAVVEGDTAGSLFGQLLNQIGEWGSSWRAWGETVIRRYGGIDGGFTALKIIEDKIKELEAAGVSKEGNAGPGGGTVRLPGTGNALGNFSGGARGGSAGGSVTPPGARTRVEADTQQASEDIDEIAEKVLDLDGKTVNVRVNVTTTGAAALGVPS